MTFALQPLPPDIDLETKATLTLTKRALTLIYITPGKLNDI